MKHKYKFKIFTITTLIILFVLALNNHTIIRSVHYYFYSSSEDRQLYEQIAKNLLVYKVYNKNNEPMSLIRIGSENDGGYVVVDDICKSSDVLMGYGVGYNISFEEGFSMRYGKPSYGFDCGKIGVVSTTKLFKLIPQCIGTDVFLDIPSSSSGNISTFSKQIQDLGLRSKNILIKMDIEGAEYEVFDDILKHKNHITSVVIEVHFGSMDQTLKVLNLITELNKDFVLVHLHANNNSIECFSTSNTKGLVPKVLELTYVNKSLVSRYELSENQSHPTELDFPNSDRIADYEFTILP